jgi:DNA repair exonuclease SbcCD ATPase subunit
VFYKNQSKSSTPTTHHVHLFEFIFAPLTQGGMPAQKKGDGTKKRKPDEDNGSDSDGLNELFRDHQQLVKRMLTQKTAQAGAQAAARVKELETQLQQTAAASEAVRRRLEGQLTATRAAAEEHLQRNKVENEQALRSLAEEKDQQLRSLADEKEQERVAAAIAHAAELSAALLALNAARVACGGAEAANQDLLLQLQQAQQQLQDLQRQLEQAKGELQEKTRLLAELQAMVEGFQHAILNLSLYAHLRRAE